MAGFTVRLDTSNVNQALDRLRDRAPIAIMRALNRSAGTGKTFMARKIAGDIGVQVGKVKDQIVVVSATQTTLRARVSVTGARLPLIGFNARGPEPSRGRGRGVSARLKGGAGKYPHAFIASLGSGHRGVFQRKKSSPRLPVVELRGPSLPHVFGRYLPDGQTEALNVLSKNLAHEVKFLLRGTE